MRTVKEMQYELQDLKYQVTEINRSLRDFHNRQDDLKNQGNKTYPHMKVEDERKGYRFAAVKWAPDTTGERGNIIAQWDRLNQHYAPVTDERRYLNSKIKELEKLIKWTIEYQRKHPQQEFPYDE